MKICKVIHAHVINIKTAHFLLYVAKKFFYSSPCAQQKLLGFHEIRLCTLAHTLHNEDNMDCCSRAGGLKKLKMYDYAKHSGESEIEGERIEILCSHIVVSHNSIYSLRLECGDGSDNTSRSLISHVGARLNENIYAAYTWSV